MANTSSFSVGEALFSFFYWWYRLAKLVLRGLIVEGIIGAVSLIVWALVNLAVSGATMYSVLYAAAFLAVPGFILVQCVNWGTPEHGESPQQELFRNWFWLTALAVYLAGLGYADYARSVSIMAR